MVGVTNRTIISYVFKHFQLLKEQYKQTYKKAKGKSLLAYSHEVGSSVGIVILTLASLQVLLIL